MFLAFREKRHAKRLVKSLLEAYSRVSAENADLSGKALYREVLLQTPEVDPQHVDNLLRSAEDSLDEWTNPDGRELGFREVVHYVVLMQYLKAGHAGAVVPFGDVVNSLIPRDL